MRRLTVLASLGLFSFAGCLAMTPRGDLALASGAQPAAGAGDGEFEPPRPGFPQHPCLSPDGSLVVFSWAGDLWAVPAEGGLASRLTSHQAHEGRTAFSPDGRTLAFESDRDGPTNLYAMPIVRANGAVVGGPIGRVTVSDRSQTLGGFSADGRRLYYSARRDPTIYRHARMYAAPLEGGPAVPLTDAFGMWPRESPGGDRILFTRGYGNIWDRPKYRGPGTMDLWALEADGSFTQLTSMSANDGDGFALPDGSVVFVSSRDGQNNVWRLEAGADDGGEAEGPGLRQLTSFAPTDEQLTIAHGVRDFSVSHDGGAAVFAVWDTLYTLDLGDANAQPRPLEVIASVDSDRLDHERIGLDRRVEEAALSPDGRTMAVAARGELFTRATEEDHPTRRVTDTHARERQIVWSPDNQWLYFVTDESGNADIYRARVDVTRDDIRPQEAKDEEESGDEPEADDGEEGEAAVAGDPVSGEWRMEARSEAIPEGALAFTMELTLEGERITGEIGVPGIYDGPLSGSFDRDSGRASLTFEVQGEQVAVELTFEDGAARGTATAEGVVYELSGTRTAAPRPDEAGDGEQAEAPGEGESKEQKKKEEDAPDPGERWAEALTFTTEPLVATDEDEQDPVPSPDGRRLIYRRGLGDLVLLDLQTLEERTLLEGWNAPEVVWVGDNRHIVYAQVDLDFNSDIWLLDALDEEAEPINLTRHPDYDTSPRISRDGKVLVFLSDRAGDNWQHDVWRVYLDRELEGLTSYELASHFKDAAASAKKAKPVKPVRTARPGREAEGAEDAGEEENDAQELPEPLEFDADDAYLRVRRLTTHNGREGDLAIAPGGERVIYSSGSTLYSVDYNGQDRKTVHSGSVSNVTVNLAGDKVAFVSGGQAQTAPTGGGRTETWPISATNVVNIPQQQRQKFLEFSRIMATRFYHPTMKGLDWDALTGRYLQLAEATRTSDGFNRVGNLMLGELDASHLGIRGGDSYSGGSESVGHLGVEVEPAPGGYAVRRVVKGSPADQNASRIDVGEVILEIDGVALSPDPAAQPTLELRDAMRQTAGKETLVKLRTPQETERFVLITPIGFGALNNLAYEQEVLDRRELVERLSEGRIGYLHIRGMSEPSVRDFERDLYAAASGKDGLLIDVRDNGGGWTTDILLASLTAPAHAYTVPRGARAEDALPNAYPRDRRLIYGYQKPISVLINQHSFSNAEIFAHAIKTIGRGRLVGEQTFGGVISTGSARLIDGTSVRTPFRGWYLPDGTDMEHNGAAPDIHVPQSPADEAAGSDPQLEAAVRELLERVESDDDGIWQPGE